MLSSLADLNCPQIGLQVHIYDKLQLQSHSRHSETSTIYLLTYVRQVYPVGPVRLSMCRAGALTFGAQEDTGA